MPRSAISSNLQPSALYPGASRRVVAEMESAAVRIEETVYCPGLCIARHAHVQISRQFHQRFGCTISEYMRRIRIARAQSLLSCSHVEVSDIALASGFCDQSHFTNTFRRVTGMPPRRYRQLICGKHSSSKNPQARG